MAPELYPEQSPFASGRLDVGDGQRLYWETCGNPMGQPALALHGGPGSGCSPRWRRYFDPKRYKAVLFDQRGAGRSTPHASTPVIDLSKNNTPHLIDDIERLRIHLGIDRWLVLGGSWGSTLALAYAQAHPHRVTALALFSVATTTAMEIDWITRGVGRFFPDAWARFSQAVPQAERDGCLATAYNRLLLDPDPAVHAPAAQRWCDWESAVVALGPNAKPSPRYEDPQFRLGFARLVTHYWRHRAWLAEGELLSGMARLNDIPGVLIHGALDLGSPLLTAWRLAKAWPGAKLDVVPMAGHDAGDTGMTARIISALDGFPGALPPDR
jgi:proline iminopeptidase